MLYPVHDMNGNIVRQIELRDDVFGIAPREAVVHQAMVRQLANRRQGTTSTKSRGEVAGSTRKLFREKGTGRARAGGIRSPTRRGGGVAFGPHPRSHRQAMPKKMRRLALRSVLSARAASEELVLVEALPQELSKTREMVQVLQALKVEAPALVVTEAVEHQIVQSARNLPRVKVLPAPLLNVADLLSSRRLVMTVAAAQRVEELWGLAAQKVET
ncbi:MAG: 50S ribosomal protein L4 [Chloroflexi bacterium]|nr:50S ribosomal protein L4 [Chloroflexota bacterium]